MKDRSIYTPLIAAERDLRLVDLLPGPRDSDIQCRLRTTTLDAFNLNFDALSYEWGDTEIPRRQIALNDQPFEVRENLWLALQALRSWTEVKTLWIDAICINQNDDDEKNHQVGLMGYIYGKASRVRVWLGTEDENSKAAFHLIKEIADCCGDIEFAQAELYELWVERKNSSSNSELISRESKDYPFESWDEYWDDFCKMLIFTSDRHPQAWQGLVALLQRTYWKTDMDRTGILPRSGNYSSLRRGINERKYFSYSPGASFANRELSTLRLHSSARPFYPGSNCEQCTSNMWTANT